MSEEKNPVKEDPISPNLSYDEELMKSTSAYFSQSTVHLKTLSNKFEKSNYFWRLFDCRKWSDFFTLNPTKIKDAQAEIKKYEEFYKNLQDALKKMKTPRVTDGTSNENSKKEGDTSKEENERNEINECILEPYNIALQMNVELTKMLELAQSGEKTTRSRKIHELHESFIKEHDKLLLKIKDLECMSLKQAVSKAFDLYHETKEMFRELKNDIKACDEKNKNMENAMQTILADNRELKEMMKELLSRK